MALGTVWGNMWVCKGHRQSKHFLVYETQYSGVGAQQGRGHALLLAWAEALAGTRFFVHFLGLCTPVEVERAGWLV